MGAHVTLISYCFTSIHVRYFRRKVSSEFKYILYISNQFNHIHLYNNSNGTVHGVICQITSWKILVEEYRDNSYSHRFSSNSVTTNSQNNTNWQHQEEIPCYLKFRLDSVLKSGCLFLVFFYLKICN